MNDFTDLVGQAFLVTQVIGNHTRQGELVLLDSISRGALMFRHWEEADSPGEQHWGETLFRIPQRCIGVELQAVRQELLDGPVYTQRRTAQALEQGQVYQMRGTRGLEQAFRQALQAVEQGLSLRNLFEAGLVFAELRQLTGRAAS